MHTDSHNTGYLCTLIHITLVTYAHWFTHHWLIMHTDSHIIGYLCTLIHTSMVTYAHLLVIHCTSPHSVLCKGCWVVSHHCIPWNTLCCHHFGLGCLKRLGQCRFGRVKGDHRHLTLTLRRWPYPEMFRGAVRPRGEVYTYSTFYL